MNANDVIELLDDSIRTAKETGTTTVPIERLEAFAAEVTRINGESPSETALPEAQLEHYKAKLNAWVSSHQQAHEWNLEMLRSVITTGQSALKSALLINGAAAVALLAFIGNVWSSPKGPQTIAGIPSAMSYYVIGVLVAAVAAGFTYLSQAGYGSEFGKASRVIGVAGHIGAVSCAVASYVLFGYASLTAYRVFIAYVG